MRFTDRTHVTPQILHFDPLDGERDAVAGVVEGVAKRAVLKGLVLDVVTQQLIARTPPLYGQLRGGRVAMVTHTRQRNGLTRLTEHFNKTTCRQKTRWIFKVTILADSYGDSIANRSQLSNQQNNISRAQTQHREHFGSCGLCPRTYLHQSRGNA